MIEYKLMLDTDSTRFEDEVGKVACYLRVRGKTAPPLLISRKLGSCTATICGA